jgi:K+-sensing histidine kinase KdpD
VQAIVEAHAGRLVLENRPEGGLSAAIELPLAVRQPSEHESKPLPASEPVSRAA